MDSSTAEKYSRHIIVRVPGRAFSNNLVMGHFVTNLTSSPEAKAKLYVARPGSHPRPPQAAAAEEGLAHAQAGMPAADRGGMIGQGMGAGAAQQQAAACGVLGAAGGAEGGGALVGLPSRAPHPAAIAAAEYAAARGHGGAAGSSSGRGDLVCFVDTAVYTKNRHFRLIWSSKGGKRAVLEPTIRFAMSAAAK